MAATCLIALHINKGRTLAQCIHDRTDYAMNPEKTAKGELVTSYECDPMTVDEEFLLTKRQYQQITGRGSSDGKHFRGNDVIAYQIRQSFKPGEVTAEKANAIGRELALRFTKGKYAFIVATHTDRAHIHNHIIFNSTNLEGTRKFNNFFFSGIALQRCSDLICLEHGLSVITPHALANEPAPRGGRRHPMAVLHPRKESIRDQICADLDRILNTKPTSFEEMLHRLEEAGYEIKRGKNISVRGHGQKRFVRLNSLKDGFKESDLRILFEKQEQMREHVPKETPLSLLIDVQSKMQSKGVGYERWAKKFNVKQMAKTLLFLRDHKIDSVEQLNQLVSDRVDARDQAMAYLKEKEKRLSEIATLRKHIINYSKTRTVYEEYRKHGYNRKFLAEHRAEIELHKAAKQAFDQLGVGKIPRMKELNAEYAAVLAEKRAAYSEYQQVQDAVKEYLVAQKNVQMMLADDETADKKRRRRDRER